VLNILQDIKQEFKKTSIAGLSMQNRLFLFLLVLVFVMLGIFVMFFLLGNFPANLKEREKVISNELTHLAKDISDQYGALSVHAVDFARGLAASIEKSLSKQGLTVTDLPNNPQILENLLGDEYERLLFSLQKTKSSGVFVILDTTVNPNLLNAKNSKAGLYIKNMEPNIINSSSPNILVLRGPPNIARRNSLQLHAQWAMEFNVSNAPYYWLPREQAAKKNLPLSRLYYWTPSTIIPNTNEEVMLCSIPLIDSRGNIFGVCGFEVSSMLFKLAYIPDNSTYHRIFLMLSPLTGNTLNTSGAFFSGSYQALNNQALDKSLHIKLSNKSFHTYTQGETVFAGFHDTIQLYPKGSPFFDQQWAVSLLIPQQDIKTAIIHRNRQIIRLYILLFGIGIIISYFICRRYTKPITEGLDIIKSKNLEDAPKLKIPEIDDLIEFLSSHSKKETENPASQLPDAIFDEFVKNTKKLSPAERAVFDLYVQGYTAKEITQILCLSINTIKTHNKRIYTKLNVASRQDLLNYVNMLKEMGKEII
jgi:DNA-binding CsgD family transcriptional regulator